METKPLELLHELLLRAGEAVTKDELLDAVWPDVSVVEASLTTAVLKLRRALGDDDQGSRIIETVPRIGYRLAVPVEVDNAPGPETRPPDLPTVETSSSPPRRSFRRWIPVAAGLAVAFVTGMFATGRIAPVTEALAFRSTSQREALAAIRTMDVEQLETLIRNGWNPDTPFDGEGNGALNVLFEVCEWNPGHNRAQLLVAARTLIDGGARIDRHNVWGDTPYSIARAQRYCGPDHPASRMLHILCFEGASPPGDRCLPRYNRNRG